MREKRGGVRDYLLSTTPLFFIHFYSFSPIFAHVIPLLFFPVLSSMFLLKLLRLTALCVAASTVVVLGAAAIVAVAALLAAGAPIVLSCLALEKTLTGHIEKNKEKWPESVDI